MKRKALAVALCIFMTSAPVKAVDQEGDALPQMGSTLGQVVTMDPSSLTIAVGNLIQAGEGSPMDFTGEERTAFLTEETLYLDSGEELWDEPPRETESFLDSISAFLSGKFSLGLGSFFGKESQDEPQPSLQGEGGYETPPSSQAEEGSPQMEEAAPGEEKNMADVLPGGYEALRVGDYVSIEMDERGNAKTVTKLNPHVQEASPAGEENPAQSPQEEVQEVNSYESVLTFVEDTQLKDQDIVSNAADENAVLVQDGAQVELSGVHISRGNKESSGGAASSYYGVGAGALVTNGLLTMKNCIIRTASEGSAALFSYRDGKGSVSDSTLHTGGGNSPVLSVAGGGSLSATDVVATTEGKSSPAVCIERGGGTMTLEGGSYTSLNVGSPVIRSKGEMKIQGAALVATVSEAVRLEGTGSLSLTDCYLYGKSGYQEEHESTKENYTVLLYRSTPMDSDSTGESSFEMKGGTLESGNGGLFYATNTCCQIFLEGVDLILAEDSPYLLCCSAGPWGTSGANGASCSLTARDQLMKGDILWDSLSSLAITLEVDAHLQGSIQKDQTDTKDTDGEGSCSLILEEGATWTVCGNSRLTSLTLRGGSLLDTQGRTVSVVGSDGTVLIEGESTLQVSVEELTSVSFDRCPVESHESLGNREFWGLQVMVPRVIWCPNPDSLLPACFRFVNS